MLSFYDVTFNSVFQGENDFFYPLVLKIDLNTNAKNKYYF